MKKRMLVFLAAALLMVALLPTAVFAHGHNHTGQGYALCVVEGCNTAGLHQHEGVTYAGHRLGDGHDYHQVCMVEGCTQTVNHQHEGVTCFPHNSGDGHHHSVGYGRKRHH